MLPSFYEAMKDLPDSDRLQLYDAIARYGLFREVIELPPYPRSLFVLMQPVIDASQNRYRASKENGGKPPKEGSNPRGRPRKNQSKNQTENQNKNHDIETKIDSDIEIDNDLDSEFPKLEEIKAFCRENHYKVDPVHFFEYNQARGWKIGGAVITDWQALIRSWEKKETSKSKKYTTAAEYQVPPACDPAEIWQAVELI